MTYLSLFSGIGGFDLALDRAGFRCVGQVEIDKDCNRVLASHWPNVQRHQNVETYQGKRGAADIVCGGFPCQDLSVAGKRAGLAGKRSGLWSEFRRVIAEVAPRWVLIENVPGLLSSNGPRDMGALLWQLGQLGYGWSYRVLDLQFFRVPQRRRRVFIVGCLGDAGRAAQVLFEPESCDGDSAPRREAGEGVAGSLGGGAAGRGWNDDTDRAGAFIPDVYGGNNCTGPRAAAAVNAGGQRRQDFETENFVVTHTLKGEGHDGSEDGTGRGVLLVFESVVARNGRGAPDTKARALRASADGGRTDCRPLVFQQNQRNELREMEVAGALPNQPGMKQQNYLNAGGIRRLTPLECLRLQSFPDDWLDLDPPISDSAKYRMTGNAIAPIVAEWIARRIASLNQ